MSGYYLQDMYTFNGFYNDDEIIGVYDGKIFFTVNKITDGKDGIYIYDKGTTRRIYEKALGNAVRFSFIDKHIVINGNTASLESTDGGITWKYNYYTITLIRDDIFLKFNSNNRKIFYIQDGNELDITKSGIMFPSTLYDGDFVANSHYLQIRHFGTSLYFALSNDYGKTWKTGNYEVGQSITNAYAFLYDNKFITFALTSDGFVRIIADYDGITYSTDKIQNGINKFTGIVGIGNTFFVSYAGTGTTYGHIRLFNDDVSETDLSSLKGELFFNTIYWNDGITMFYNGLYLGIRLSHNGTTIFYCKFCPWQRYESLIENRSSLFLRDKLGFLHYPPKKLKAETLMFLSRNNDYESIPLVAYNDDCYDVAYMAHFADNVFYKPAKKNVSMSHITGGRIPDVFYLVQG